MKKTLLLLAILLTTISYSQEWVTALPNQGNRAKLVKTLDGGFVVFFRERINDTETKSNLYKYDNDGNFVWVQEIVSDVLLSVRVQFIYNTPDNGFILTASRTGQTDVSVLIKLNEFGIKEHEIDINNEVDGVFRDISINENTYTIRKNYNVNETKFFYLFDKQLNLIEINETEEFNSGNHHLLNKGNDELFIFKGGDIFNDENDSEFFYSDLQINHTLDNSTELKNFPIAKKTYNNGYILIDDWSECCFPWHQGDILLINENLDEVWSFEMESFIQNGVSYYLNVNITPIQDGGFVFGGSLGNELFNTVQLHKIDANGNLLWRFAFDAFPYEYLYDIIETDDGGVVMLVNDYAGGGDGLGHLRLVKTYANGQLATNSFETTNNFIKIYPNPAKDFLHLNFKKPFNGILKIHSITGVLQVTKSVNNLVEKRIDLTNLSKGVYFINLYDKENNKNYYKKIIKK